MASRSGCKQIVKKGEGQKLRSALLAIQFWLIVSREGVIGEERDPYNVGLRFDDWFFFNVTTRKTRVVFGNKSRLVG